ncbi:DUF924 domain-containing protein [Sandaracinobacteroides saxicola]|uniref:DUF924 domain-containing protein n=1 Tax=Sandaracinobacteroides saxicola TaxID=2759707 RepID=A0A7G5IMM1_9SPHN|nr:DUF924 domain-containing protein [Sandaracinobacteroides saxicola]
MTAEAQGVLDFWLAETPAEKRFARDAALDAAIAARFGGLHARLSEAVPEDWVATARGLLAAVIVLDQFSRNLFRDDGRAFAQDGVALGLTKAALARGDLERLDATEQQFLLLPLMHSEVLADQDRMVAEAARLGLGDVVDFARRHREAIARFGRFPARNAALGRVSTAAEVAFLRDNPDGF